MPYGSTRQKLKIEAHRRTSTLHQPCLAIYDYENTESCPATWLVIGGCPSLYHLETDQAWINMLKSLSQLTTRAEIEGQGRACCFSNLLQIAEECGESFIWPQPQCWKLSGSDHSFRVTGTVSVKAVSKLLLLLTLCCRSLCLAGALKSSQLSRTAWTVPLLTARGSEGQGW